MSEIKQFAGIARSPDSQFQIGDRVLYLPEGIYARVDGYFWNRTIGECPRVVSYLLSCGIEAPENTIARTRVGEPA